MLQIIITIAGRIGFRIGVEPLSQSIVDVPVRGIDGDGTILVSVLRKEGAHPIAVLGGIAFFQKWKAEQPTELRIVLDDCFATAGCRRSTA